MNKNVVYIKTDRNGTKIYHDFSCQRCGGAGGSKMWNYTGYTCYECGGTGRSMKHSTIKEYTPEYRAILDERAAKRSAKAKAAANETAAIRRAEWMEQNGFNADGFTNCVIGGYEIRESLKAAGFKYNLTLGWHTAQETEFETVQIHIDAVTRITEYGDYVLFNEMPEILKVPEIVSDHVGTIGDKIEIAVKFITEIRFQTNFGWQSIYKFADGSGNVIVWKTSAGIPEFDGYKIMMATVKDHGEYNGEKQTNVIRVKIK